MSLSWKRFTYWLELPVTESMGRKLTICFTRDSLQRIIAVSPKRSSCELWVIPWNHRCDYSSGNWSLYCLQSQLWKSVPLGLRSQVKSLGEKVLSISRTLFRFQTVFERNKNESLKEIQELGYATLVVEYVSVYESLQDKIFNFSLINFCKVMLNLRNLRNLIGERCFFKSTKYIRNHTYHSFTPPKRRETFAPIHLTFQPAYRWC